MKNKNKITRKKRVKKNKRKKTIKQFGGEILGKGVQGCIVDSIESGDYTKNNGFVAKIMKKETRNSDREKVFESIQMKLKEFDPNEERYALYHKQILDISQNKDVKKCENLLGDELDTNNIFFTKKMDVINPLELTKIQWRYLRDSVSLLRKIGIIHGDLPGNIMLNPNTNMPVIIDWDGSFLITHEQNESTLAMDFYSFMNPSHFSIKR